jgi:hypothetical protein
VSSLQTEYRTFTVQTDARVIVLDEVDAPCLGGESQELVVPCCRGVLVTRHVDLVGHLGD